MKPGFYYMYKRTDDTVIGPCGPYTEDYLGKHITETVQEFPYKLERYTVLEVVERKLVLETVVKVKS